MNLEDEEAILPIKFVAKGYEQEFEEGKIFMKPSSYYIELEKRESKGIGDKREGLFYNYNPRETALFMEHPETKQLMYIGDNPKHFEGYENVKRMPIFCITYLRKNDFKHADDGLFKIRDEVLEELNKEFNNHTPYIIDRKRFEQRVDEACQKEDLYFRKGLVTYYNFDREMPLSRESFENAPFRTLFFKTDFFRNQKEFRYVFHKITDESFILNIGELNNIVFRTDDLANTRMKIYE